MLKPTANAHLNLYLSFTFLNNGVDIRKLFAALTERMRRIFNPFGEVIQRNSRQKTIINLQNPQKKRPINLLQLLIGRHRPIHRNCRRNLIKTALCRRVCWFVLLKNLSTQSVFHQIIACQGQSHRPQRFHRLIERIGNPKNSQIINFLHQ